MMQRALSSLLVVLVVLALAVRGVAAPVIHLHDGWDGATAIAAAPIEAETDHAHEAVASDDAGLHGQPAHDHSGKPDPHAAKDPITGKKICDASGACCGSIAAIDRWVLPAASVMSHEPDCILSTAGVKPASPDRPPSPPIA